MKINNRKSEILGNEESENIAIHYINKLLNITKYQWPRVIISWLIQFFNRMGFIIGWTALTAIFIGRFGVSALPYFFITNALFIIVGAIIYSNFINSFKKTHLIIGTILAGATLLFLSTFFATANETIFIFLCIIIESIFLSQLYILNSAFIEELFTPMESEKTFPLIESAETFGGIVGGLVVVLHANNIATYKFIYMWIVLMLLIIPIIIGYQKLYKKTPHLAPKKRKYLTHFNTKEIKGTLDKIKSMPFLKTLLFVILIQWILVNLMEFQYTKAVVQNIHEPEVTMQQALTHGLGTLHILFHSFALLTQLFFASRIISTLGIIGSLLLHPIVNLLSLGALTFRFGFTSAVLAKTNFEITNTIHKNAYHTSYYAIKSDIREQIREFLEGIAKPLGTLFGTISLIVLQQFFREGALTFSINITMVAITIFMLVILLKNENRYTSISKKNLLYSDNSIVKINAIEILGQNGHKGATEILLKCLSKPDEDPSIKIKILETLGNINDTSSIPEIIDCLDNENLNIQIAAVKSLSKFNDLEKHFLNQAFSVHRIITALQELFKNQENRTLRSEIIHLLAKIDKKGIVPFLLDLLQSNDEKIKADCIYVCGHFKDINVAHYILPYLESSNYKIRANTIIALWQFIKFRIQLHPILSQMLNSKNEDEKMEAIYILGEIKAVQEKKRLKELLYSPNRNLQLLAGISLAKMNSTIGINEISNATISEDDEFKNLADEHIEKLPEKMRKIIQKITRQKISIQIHNLLLKQKAQTLEELDKDALIKLKKAYELANEHEEVQNIKELIDQKSNDHILEFNPA